MLHGTSIGYGLIETFWAVSRSAKANIHFDAFKHRYVIEKFDGDDGFGGLIFVKQSFAPNQQAARNAANDWIEQRV